MAVTGINHIVLKVRELDRSEAFYALLGFERSGAREGMRFLRAGTHHHHVALFEVGADAPPAPREAVGLFHFCVTVEAEAELGTLHRRLAEAGHRVGEGVDHIVSRSFYAVDPDGHVVEVTWDVPEQEWAHLENPFATDRPYTLPGEPR